MPRIRKPIMTKTRHDKALEIEHEGFRWTVDAAEWRDAEGHGELRVYAIHGDVTTPALAEALELEAATRGLAASIQQ